MLSTSCAPFVDQALASDVAAGTLVLTLDGAIPVEYLNAGDRIITRTGAQTLLGTRTRVVADCPMIRISNPAGSPHADLLLPPDQAILVHNWQSRSLTGNTQATIAAHSLVDDEFIRHETVAAQCVVRLEFSTAVVVYAGHLQLALPAAA
jgi:hypothetical protein